MKSSLLILTILSGISCFAAATVKQEKYAGQNVVTLDNEKLTISVDPAKGGRGIRFYLKDLKKNLVPKNYLGFFADHWGKYDWPSGLMHLPYNSKMIPGKGKASVKLWVKVPAKGGGKGSSKAPQSLQMPTDPELKDLIIAKTITIMDNSDIVRVDMEFSNPTTTPRAIGYYAQHHFTDLEGASRRWDIPSTDGITGRTLQPNSRKPQGPDWVREPTAGWMAYNTFKTKKALVFEFDYNYLDRIYTSSQTAEWMMDPVMITPGKNFKTTYYIFPVNGMERFCGVKDGIAAGFSVNKKGKAGTATLELISRLKTNKNLNVNIKVLDLASKRILTEKDFKIKELGDQIRRYTIKFDSEKEVILRGTVTGQDINQVFEYNYLDEESEFNRRYNFAQVGQGAAALAGSKELSYSMKQPVKVKHFDKPDFSRIPKFKNTDKKLFIMFGMFTDHLKIYETFRNEKNTKMEWSNAHPLGMSTFPARYEDLFTYRLMFMCNVNFKSIGYQSMEMLKDYVEHGGSLIITGGFYTYGHGDYTGTAFEKIVPFEGMKPFDFTWAGKGKNLTLKAKTTDPLLKNVDFSKNPQVQWYHDVKLKKGAVVLAELSNGKPGIVKYKYGKGTVIACTIAPFGTPDNPWWLWDGWATFMKNCSEITK